MNAMNIQEIHTYLPHRYPFLLLDRVSDYDIESGVITGTKNVSINEFFFQGHFPQQPIMPGVLIIEALAQLAGILAFKRAGLTPADGYMCYLAAVDGSRFKKPVHPGDQLQLRAQLVNERALMLKFKCEASVSDSQVCTSEVILAGVQS